MFLFLWDLFLFGLGILDFFGYRSCCEWLNGVVFLNFVSLRICLISSIFLFLLQFLLLFESSLFFFQRFLLLDFL